MTAARQSTSNTKIAVDNPASQPSDSHGSGSDYTLFIWQKLDTIEKRFVDFSEKYGRMDAKLDEIHRRIEKSESKLSEVADVVKQARSWALGALAVLAGLSALLYKLGAFAKFDKFLS